MSSIIQAVGHALTGHGDNSDKKYNVHTVVYEDVKIESIISSETQPKAFVGHSQNKINELMAKLGIINKFVLFFFKFLKSFLGSTHSQIDEYSRRRTEQITEEVAASINRIVADTQVQQASLLADANARSATIEEEYRLKLQQFVGELDTVKAQNLATLEKDLNLRQEMILDEAKRRIDDLNEEANRLKLGVLREAQAQTNAKVGAITEQVAT